MRVLAVLGAEEGGGAAERRVAANGLRIATTALFSFTILQQRHLRQHREEMGC